MIEKASKLDNVRYEIRGPVLDEANRMIADGAKVLKLNIGNPAPVGFTTPEEIIRDMQMNLHDCEGYSDSKGIFSARKAIMQYCQLKQIPNVDVGDIYTGNGCSEMITLSLQALLNSGDEILLPAPDYPLWTASVSLAGGRPVHYICDEKSNWYPDLADIESKITPKRSQIRQKLLLSSTRTIRRAFFIRRKFLKASSISRADTGLSSSPMRYTTVSFSTAKNTSRSLLSRPTFSAST